MSDKTKLSNVVIKLIKTELTPLERVGLEMLLMEIEEKDFVVKQGSAYNLDDNSNRLKLILTDEKINFICYWAPTRECYLLEDIFSRGGKICDGHRDEINAINWCNSLNSGSYCTGGCYEIFRVTTEIREMFTCIID